MPVLKSLSFTALPKVGNNPVQMRRAKFITKLEEQKLLLKDPKHVRTVQRCKSPLHCHAVAFDAGAKIEAATNHKGDSQSERVVSHHRAKHHSIKAASVGGLFLSIARTETQELERRAIR